MLGLKKSLAAISWFVAPDSGEVPDLRLLRCQLAGGVVAASAGSLAGGGQLTFGACGEGVGTHHREDVVGHPQLLARLGAALLAPQPFAEHEPGAGVLDGSGVVQPVDRFAVVVLRARIVGDECARASEEASSERLCRAFRCGSRTRRRRRCARSSRAGSGCRLDEIGEVGGREERIVAVAACWRSTALLRSGRVRVRGRPWLGRRRRASSRGAAGGRPLRPRPPRGGCPPRRHSTPR